MSNRADSLTGALVIVLLSFLFGYPVLVYLSPITGEWFASLLLVHVGTLVGVCVAYAVAKTAKAALRFFLFRPGILPIVYAFFLTNVATVQAYLEEAGMLRETAGIPYLLISVAFVLGWYGLVRKNFGLLSDWVLRKKVPQL